MHKLDNIKLVFFDCDGVLTDDGWRKLDRVAIPDNVHAYWKSRYDDGKLTLDQWIEETQKTYLNFGLTRSFIQRLYKQININPEAIEIFRYLRMNMIKTAIISSGFELYVSRISEKLGANFFRVNTKLLFDTKGEFKGFEYLNPNAQEAKVNAVKDICLLLNIAVEETIFVGDSIVDLEAFKLTNHGVLYQMKEFEAHIEELEKYSWKKIKNLSEIKILLKNYESTART